MFLDHLALHMEKKNILLELLFHVFSQEGGKKKGTYEDYPAKLFFPNRFSIHNHRWENNLDIKNTMKLVYFINI